MNTMDGNVGPRDQNKPVGDACVCETKEELIKILDELEASGCVDLVMLQKAADAYPGMGFDQEQIVKFFQHAILICSPLPAESCKTMVLARKVLGDDVMWTTYRGINDLIPANARTDADAMPEPLSNLLSKMAMTVIQKEGMGLDED